MGFEYRAAMKMNTSRKADTLEHNAAMNMSQKADTVVEALGNYLGREFTTTNDAHQLRPTGFEPVAYGLEIRCSIQLSYGRINN